MAEKEKFFCHQAATKGFQEITEDYCLTECDSPQRGAKAECPLSVRPQLPGEAPKETESMKELLEQLKELNLPEDEFAIFGSGPLGIRGIREINDLDLVVSPELWEKISQKYPVIEKKLGKSVNLTENIEATPDLGFGLKSKEIIENADIIDGIRYINLDTTIKWKKKMGRKKDLEDIRLIKQYLRNNRP